jgi:thioredoxin reductase/NAD-dependent dihydropyrimidine dehydrogenase PreA subunit
MILAALGAVTAGLYGAWAWLDRRRHRRAARVLADLSALGDDAVPTSIHPEVDPHLCIGSGSCVRACPEADVIGLVGGRARLVNPLACVGHGACAAACPVGAIQLVFGTARRGIELPVVDPQFQTSQPGVYVVGELGGTGLIRNAVEQGRQAARAIAAAGRSAVDRLDTVVVGAGPAGLAAALGLLEAGQRVQVLEQDEFGGTARHYPRHKVVMTGSLDLPLYGVVRRRTMSKEELIALWQEVRARTSLPIETGIQVAGLEADPGGGWRVVAGARRWQAASVVLALGRRGTPRRLGVPGEELAKVHYRLLEPEPFAGQDVLVVGGGNAAAECALALAGSEMCRSVTVSYRRAAFVRLRAGVRARLDASIATGSIRALMSSAVLTIGERDALLDTSSGRMQIANDAVIVQVGGTPPSQLLASCGIATIEKRGEA